MQNPDRPRKSAYLQYLYLLVLLPCLVHTVVYTAHAIRLDYTAVPFWDSWRSPQYLDQLLRFDPRHFWVQHNEHRIVFPEMVYALDYIFFRGELLLPIACNIASQLAQLALLWWLLWRMKDMPLGFRLTLGVCCSLFMTSAMQVQAILGTFELQWYLSQLAAAAAFLFLWRSASTGRWASLAISIGAAIVATYSTSNGMMLWPVLVAMAVLLRLPKRYIACVALAGILSIAAYFVDYKFMGQGRTALLLAHPFYAIWFAGVFLGTPVSYASTRLGGFAGLSGVLLVVLGVAIAARQRKLGEPVLVVTAGVCLYTAGSALMIAYGRMDPSDPAFSGALPPRYVCVPLTCCANLAIVIGWLIMRLPRRTPLALQLGAATLTLVVLVAVIRPQRSYEKIFAAQQARGNEAGIALVAGVEDPDVISVIFPVPQFVVAVSPGIRQRRLSIFAAGRQDWIGQPVSQTFVPGSPNLCSGAIETLSAVKGGYRATGWALDQGAGRPPEDIVLTNSAGVIIGFGATRPGGYSSGNHWVGFARDTGMSGTIQAYAIVNGGKAACPIKER